MRLKETPINKYLIELLSEFTSELEAAEQLMKQSRIRCKKLKAYLDKAAPSIDSCISRISAGHYMDEDIKPFYGVYHDFHKDIYALGNKDKRATVRFLVRGIELVMGEFKHLISNRMDAIRV